MNKLGFSWPEFLLCDQFPNENCLGQQETSTTEIVNESGMIVIVSKCFCVLTLSTNLSYLTGQNPLKYCKMRFLGLHCFEIIVLRKYPFYAQVSYGNVMYKFRSNWHLQNLSVQKFP